MAHILFLECCIRTCQFLVCKSLASNQNTNKTVPLCDFHVCADRILPQQSSIPRHWNLLSRQDRPAYFLVARPFTKSLQSKHSSFLHLP